MIFANAIDFNPTIEVVIFCLRGWCMLELLLLPAFIRLGHERQDLLSPCNEIHAFTDYTSIYTLIQKSFYGMESEPMLAPREKHPLYRRLRGGSNSRRCIRQDSEPSTLPTELSWPHVVYLRDG